MSARLQTPQIQKRILRRTIRGKGSGTPRYHGSILLRSERFFFEHHLALVKDWKEPDGFVEGRSHFTDASPSCFVYLESFKNGDWKFCQLAAQLPTINS